MTARQAELRRRLEVERPAVVRKDLICPKCGNRLILKVSRFGRFYGCTAWKKTRCDGSVPAALDGTPRRIPVQPRSVWELISGPDPLDVEESDFLDIDGGD